MRLTKYSLTKYAQIFGISAAIGVAVVAAVLPVILDNAGGLEMKITAAEELCVGRPAEVRIKVINGGEETYRVYAELKAPDGTKVFEGSTTSSGKEGFYLKDWKPSAIGGYTLTALVEQISTDRSHEQLRTTNVAGKLNAQDCG